MRHILFVFCLIFFAVPAARPSENSALAEYYYGYLGKVLAENSKEAAELFLIRAQDYAEYSSDLSFELARIQTDLGRPRRAVLAVLNRALDTSIWRHGNANIAHLYKAETLFALGYFTETLSELEFVEDGLQKERLYLKALLCLGMNGEFIRRMKTALELYSIDEGLVRLLYIYAKKIEAPSRAGMELVGFVTEILAESQDSELIYLAVPYLDDDYAALPLLAEWYAKRRGALPHDAVPVLLNFGIIDDFMAADSIFSKDSDVNSIDIYLLSEVFALLRSQESRDYFLRKLNFFTGVIEGGADVCGVFQSRAQYKNGIITGYTNSNNNEKNGSLSLEFSGGVLTGARLVPDGIDNSPISIEYDIYPAVKRAEAGTAKYQFAPRNFFYAPVIMNRIFEGAAIAFPQISREAGINERALSAFSYIIERPSAEFPGAVEEFRMLNGIAVSAVERLNGKTVSKTEFFMGRPLLQNVDTDLDGRLETIRYFVQSTSEKSEIDYIETDWAGNGVYVLEE